MQCAEGAEATRSDLFRGVIASSQCRSAQLVHPREDSWPTRIEGGRSYEATRVPEKCSHSYLLLWPQMTTVCLL